MIHCMLLALKSIDWLGVPHEHIPGDNGVVDQQNQSVSVTLFIISLILLAWLIARIQSRMRMPQRPHRPYRVFSQLLRHQGVSASDRLVLLVLAMSRRMKQPAVLLLSPALFTRHAEAWLGGSLGSHWPGARQRLVRVAQQVFADASGSSS
jgi:hypothetical protein